MKLTEKDKKLLIILAIVLVGFFYYQFVYTKQTAKIAELNNQKNKVEQEYNTAVQLTSSLPKKKSDMKILQVKINDHLTGFYPEISQEHIILELDKLLKDSSLNGNISFNPIAVQAVEAVTQEKTAKGESSIKKDVDQIDRTFNLDGNKKSNASASGEGSTPAASSSETIEQLKATVTFTGTYENLQKFLKAVDAGEKRIVVNSITLNQQSATDVTGTMNLELYAVPKPADKDTEYLLWKLNNTYGKDSPFNSSAAVGSVATIEDIMEKKQTNDFVMSVKSNSSDLPSIMMGKANDTSRLTYVYSDSNKQENAEMVLTQVNGKYYVKYKTSSSSYPAQYSGNGEEFIPVSKDNITIQILSESRTGDNDKSSLNLKLVNNTDKLVKVQVKNEDSNNPRVKVSGEGSLINVEQK